MSVFEAVLPAGITWARVGDLYTVTRKPRGGALANSESIPFAPMDLIPQGGAFEPKYQMRRRDEITSGTYFEKGDVLVAKITPSFENGKQALARNLPGDFGYATTEVIPLRSRVDGQDRRLLFYYLLHPDVRSAVAERMEGSTGRQRVPENALLELPYPLLDSAEQLVVADVLFLVQQAIEGAHTSLEKLDALKRSTMRNVFTNGLRGESQKETDIGLTPESWANRSLLQLCDIRSGGTPRKSVAEHWAGEIPWASGKDLKAPTLHDTIDHVSQAGVKAGSRIVPAGAVLLLVRGMGLAKDLPVCVISRPMAFNQDLKALVPTTEITGAYIRSAIYFRKAALLSRIVPSAHGTMTLNLDDVENFSIPCPVNMDEQHEIVEILDAIDRKIDLHKRKRAVLEKLFNALLHKLMTGEIRVADLDLSALDTQVTAGAAA